MLRKISVLILISYFVAFSADLNAGWFSKLKKKAKKAVKKQKKKLDKKKEDLKKKIDKKKGDAKVKLVKKSSSSLDSFLKRIAKSSKLNISGKTKVVPVFSKKTGKLLGACQVNGKNADLVNAVVKVEKDFLGGRFFTTVFIPTKTENYKKIEFVKDVGITGIIEIDVKNLSFFDVKKIDSDIKNSKATQQMSLAKDKEPPATVTKYDNVLGGN